MQIQCVVDSRSRIGEGAVWDRQSARLWWVDIPAGLIHCYDPDSGENETWDFGEPVGCLAVRKSGGLVVAAKTGFWLFDPETGAKAHLIDPEADHPGNRFNDGTTDLQGRFWAGTMKDGGTPEKVGRFYRLDPDFTVTPWGPDFYTTNGSAFSPDGEQIYLSDSNPGVRRIWQADYDTTTGTPGDLRLFAETTDVAGRPDGGTVDADGCYWQAGVGGWQIYRYAPDGTRLLTLDLPVERPSKPMFGGRDLRTLYVTSIGIGLTPGTEDQQPQAGSLFAVTGLGIRGLPQTRFAG